MAVNPNLATLMRVIEDNQDKMPEGEYLEAMNALGALHRIAAIPAAVRPLPSSIPYSGLPPSYTASFPLFSGHNVVGVASAAASASGGTIAQIDEDQLRVWRHVSQYLGGRYRDMTPQEWMEQTQEQRDQLNREATLKLTEFCEEKYRNPNPKVCAFIARHAVGPWTFGTNESQWTCVCGYRGKSKNWKAHEEGERHQDWANHRIVPKRIIDMMKSNTRDQDGILIRFKAPLQGGIRYFPVQQERNEWTNPELYTEGLRMADGNGNWFVHERIDKEKIVE